MDRECVEEYSTTVASGDVIWQQMDNIRTEDNDTNFLQITAKKAGREYLKISSIDALTEEELTYETIYIIVNE